MEQSVALCDASAGDSEEVRRISDEELLNARTLIEDQESRISKLQGWYCLRFLGICHIRLKLFFLF